MRGIPRNPEFIKTRGGTVDCISDLLSLAHMNARARSRKKTNAEEKAMSAIMSEDKLLSTIEMKMRAGRKKSATILTKSSILMGLMEHSKYPPRVTSKIGSI
jgi:hypothetical protein